MKNFSSPHTHIRSLDSASTLDDFIKRELELETGTITCTDHGYLGACRDVYRAAKENSLIPILGIESYHRSDDCSILHSHGIEKNSKGSYADYYKYGHITIHAKDQEAYETLIKVASDRDLTAERHGSERKPIFTWEDLELLGSKNTTFTSGCLISIVGRHLMAGREDIARAYYEKTRSLVKPGNFYVEIFPHKCDKNFVNGIFFTLEGGQKIKYRPAKKMRTEEFQEIEAQELLKHISKGKNVGKFLAVKNYNTWEFLEPKIILQAEHVEDFLPNECSPYSPDGDMQKSFNLWLMNIANEYKDLVICSDDAHFSHPEAKVIQDVKLGGMGDSFRFSSSYHRQSSEEAFEVFKHTLGFSEKQFEEILDNNRQWASNFKDFSLKNEISLPKSFYPKDTLKHLMDLINSYGRMDWSNQAMRGRLSEEIKLLHQNGTVDLLPYFFLAQDGLMVHEEAEVLTGVGRGCLEGEALVLTSTGYKKIRDIASGEVVFTHTGTKKKVLNTFKYTVNEIGVRFNTTYKFSPFFLTKDHKVYGFKRTRIQNAGPKERVWKKELPIPSWIPAGELKKGDLIFMPNITDGIIAPSRIDLAGLSKSMASATNTSINIELFPNEVPGARTLGPRSFIQRVRAGYNPRSKTVNGKRSTRAISALNRLTRKLKEHNIPFEEWRKKKITTIPRYFEITENVAYFLGRWIGDGWINQDQKVGVAFNSNDIEGIVKISEILSPFCFAPPSAIKHKKKNLIQLMFSSVGLCKILRALFPEYKNTSGTKYIPHEWLSWPSELLKSLIRGLVDSDGSEEIGNRGLPRISIDTTSIQLCMGVKEALLRLGIPCSVLKREPFFSGKYLCNSSYKLRFKWTNAKPSGYWVEIQEIQESKLTEVFDLEVENDSSFLTSEYAVHNSSGGVMIAYLLGITHTNPLKHNLSLDRFLTLDRIKSGKLPDIDQDLPNRDILLPWLKSRFGDHYSQIGTLTLLHLKSSIKDVARATYGHVPSEMEALCAIIPNTPQGVEDYDFVFGYTGEDEKEVKGLLSQHEGLQNYVKKHPELWAKVLKLLGLNRSPGRHASGYIIADKPIDSFIPLITVGGVRVTQYTAKSCEEAGALKMDYLSLNTLSDIQDTIRELQSRQNLNLTEKHYILNGVKVPRYRIIKYKEVMYDIWDLPQVPEVFNSICMSDTVTVFQVSTASAQKWLKEFNFWTDDNRTNKLIRTMDDLAAFVALDRPGPLDAEVKQGYLVRNMLQEYASRLKGDTPIEPIAFLVENLPETQGVLVYQEQITKVFQKITECDGLKANQFREDVAKKRMSKVLTYYPDFIEKATKKVGAEDAERIWNNVMVFGGYGFNLSHAVNYAYISYACAFLKYFFPLEWWCAVLRNAKKDEIAIKFWKYCKNFVKMPDVNLSENNFTIKNNEIRAPLSILKGLGEKAHNELETYRPFKDFDDFVEKISTKRAKNKTKQAIVPLVPSEIKEKSAITRGTVNVLLASGATDSLFETSLRLADKIDVFEDKLYQATKVGRKKVPAEIVGMTTLQEYLHKKQILPIYSEFLPKLMFESSIHGVEKRERTVDGQTKISYQYDPQHPSVVEYVLKSIGRDFIFGKLAFVDGDLLNWMNTEAIIDESRPPYLAVAASVLKYKEFNFISKKDKKARKAAKFSLDVNGMVFDLVKWQNKKDELVVPSGIIDGTAAIVILCKRKNNRDFNIEALIKVEEPIKGKREKK